MNKQEIFFRDRILHEVRHLVNPNTSLEILLHTIFYKWYEKQIVEKGGVNGLIDKKELIGKEILHQSLSSQDPYTNYKERFKQILKHDPRFSKLKIAQIATIKDANHEEAILIVLGELDNNYQGDLKVLFNSVLSLFRQGDYSRGYFDTTDSVNLLMVRFLMSDNNYSQNIISVYDPTSGLGSSLLKFSEQQKEASRFYGQEINSEISLLSVMNLIINGVEECFISTGDTLSHPAFLEGNTVSKFDYVIAHPPYRLRNHAKSMIDPYNRWEKDIGNDSYLDGALFSHILASMSLHGRAAIVVPNSILSNNTKAESNIRKHIVDHGLLKAVIHLPLQVFHNTAVASTILLLGNYDFIPKDKVFFIDGKHQFVKLDKHINSIREDVIQEHVASFFNLAEQANYSLLVDKEQLAGNNYFLQAGRYFIDRFISEEVVGETPTHAIGETVMSLSLVRNTNTGTFLPLITPQHLNNNIRLALDRIEAREISKNVLILDKSALLIAYKNNTMVFSYFEYEGKQIGLSPLVSAFEINQEVVTLPYLAKQFTEDYFKYLTDSYTSGTAVVQRIPIQVFLTFPIKLEPLDVQRRLENQYLDYFHQIDKNLNILERQKDLLYEENAILRHSIAGPVLNIKAFFAQMIQVLENNSDQLVSNVLQGNIKIDGRYDFKKMQAIVQRDLEKIDNYMVKQLDMESQIQKKKLAPLDLDIYLSNYVDELKTRKPNIDIRYESFVEYLMDDVAKETYVTILGDEELLQILLDNLVSNSENHAFIVGEQNGIEVRLFFDEEEESFGIEYSNTGQSFPKGFTEEDFLAKGRKSGPGAGTGYGGWYINHILNKLDGKLEIFDNTILKEEISEGYTTSIVITLPLIGFSDGE